ncbi:MAG: CDP-diacylglycerol--glycerol-3-phosphate 3-phosphatidyltransferase [Candidatus Brocadiia bacterium]
MNLPNKITVSRFFLSIIYFILLYFSVHKDVINPKMLDVSIVVFLIAAVTDALDGYLARKYKMVTNFGRIADPFVDKILVCGSFIFFVSWDALNPFLSAWMVVVIITREFLVHGIRGMAEAKGIAFPSTSWGKQKTLVQCFTIVAVLLYVGYFRNRPVPGIILHSFIWLTIISTVISGLTYFLKAKQLVSRSDLE